MTRHDLGKLALGLVMGLGGGAAWAHEPYMDCFDNDDQRTVTCEAGYEDGSPAAADDKIVIRDDQGKTLMSGKFTDGLYTFERPGGKFVAVFVGGDIGHVRRVPDNELMKR